MTSKQNKSLVLEVHGEQLNVTEILSINEAELSNDFAQQASVFGWVANMVAEADAALSLAKHMREVAYAGAYEYWREELVLGGSKPTEAMVGAAVARDDDYCEAKEAEIHAEKHYKVLRALTDALKMRADMLISLGAHLRAERDMTGMHTNDYKLDKAVKLVREQV